MILGYEHTVSLSVLAKAVGVGYTLGFLYLFFTFGNSLSKGQTVSVFFRDVIYCSAAAVITFIFALKYNAGIVRFYILAGELIGFCLFFIFPGITARKILRQFGACIKQKYYGVFKKLKKRNEMKKKNRKNSQKILCFKQKIKKIFVKPLDIKK